MRYWFAIYDWVKNLTNCGSEFEALKFLNKLSLGDPKRITMEEVTFRKAGTVLNGQEKGLLSGHVPPQSITCGCLWCDLTIRHEKLELPEASDSYWNSLRFSPSILWHKGKRLLDGRMAEMCRFYRESQHVVTSDRFISRPLDIFPPPLCPSLSCSMDKLRMNGCHKIFQKMVL